MKLFSKASKKESIVGIILKEEEGVMLLLSFDETSAKVEKIDMERFSYTNSWERLVQDVDEHLFKLENKHDVKVKKAIFFLYSHLIDSSSDTVKDQYLVKLREVLSENNLVSLGFIEHHQAISSYLSLKEEVPLTAVLIEVDSPAISVFIYKGGAQVFSTQVAKTEKITDDIVTAFSKVPPNTILPARLILYNSSSLEDEATQIISHKFPEDLFIQLPKVEVIVSDDIYKSLLLAFQSEFNSDSVSDRSLQFDKDTSMAPPPLGTEADLSEQSELAKEKFDKEPEIDETVNAAPFGFVVGSDIREPLEESEFINNEEIHDADYQENDSDENKESLSSSENGMTISTIIATTKQKLRVLSGSARKRALLIIGFLVIVMALFAILFFAHKATLTIFYKSKPVESEITLEGEPKISIVEDTLTEKKTIATTGSTDVGEKSKGEVIIYNADTAEITFKKGTTLTTSGKKYLLGEEIKVASASTELTSGGDLLTTTGKKKTSIEAAEIGSEFNLEKDTKFTIDNTAVNKQYAITDGLITGGSKKKVRTVSQSDISRLRSILDKTIKEAGVGKKSEALAKTIPQLATLDVQKEVFSAEEGEEATELTGEMTAAISSSVYSESEMKTLLSKKLQEAVADGFEVRPENVSYKIIDAETDKETILTIEARAKPTLKSDSSRVATAIAGKKTSEVGEIIKNDFDGQGYEIVFDNNLPFLNIWVPFFTRNIEVKIKSL